MGWHKHMRFSQTLCFPGKYRLLGFCHGEKHPHESPCECAVPAKDMRKTNNKRKNVCLPPTCLFRMDGYRYDRSSEQRLPERRFAFVLRTESIVRHNTLYGLQVARWLSGAFLPSTRFGYCSIGFGDWVSVSGGPPCLAVAGSSGYYRFCRLAGIGLG